MLADLRPHTTLPAQDLERAKKFYSEKLGLTPAFESPATLDYACNGALLSVFRSMGKSNGDFTQAGWRTDNIQALVAELKSRGVVFEEYDLPGFKTVDSIATMGPVRAAYFKDSEGNLLGIAQMS